MSLFTVPITVRLIGGAEEPYEFTGTSMDAIAKAAVDRFHKDNPTKRIDWLRFDLKSAPPRTWLPAYDGWLEEQPEFIKNGSSVPLKRDGRPLDPPSAAATGLGAPRMTRAEAMEHGYTGDICSGCGSPRMKVSGHCTVCEDCGTTTGCS